MGKKRKLSDKQYLDLFRVSENKYLIGIFQDGITVYKQQIRALNIFYALYNTKLRKIAKTKGGDSYTIGVIGAGVAGLTFAAAALKTGFKVILFEQQSVYLHMQFGCDIRKIHPNLYEWPDRGYENPYAELPILDWKHNSASNVVKQIIRGWDKVKSDVTKSNTKGFKRFLEVTNCDVKQIVEAKGTNKFSISYESPGENREAVCDLVILATGYGIELGVEENAKTPSYWRNDSYSQTELNKAKRDYFISGVGDGGLIDMFRLKIFDFSYELIIDIIENHQDFPDLLLILDKIKSDLKDEKDLSPDLLYKKFNSIDSEYYSYIFDTIKSRDLFRDNTIHLNDIALKFSDTLDCKKISFLHAFLAFILILNGTKIKVFYKGGNLTHDKDSYLLNGIKITDNFNIIIRHGTDRFNSIPESYFEKDDKTLTSLKADQQKVYSHGYVHKRWSNSQLLSIFNPQSSRNYEYLNSATTVLCTNYVSSLSSLLKHTVAKKDFRISLHRLIFVQGEYFFQQITSYFGTKHQMNNESVAQVFSVERGNVGLSFRTAKPFLLINNDEDEFRKIVDNMNLNNTFYSLNRNKSFFSLPILSSKQKGADFANLVLYIDSPDENFFGLDNAEDKTAVFDLIKASTTGFVESINHNLKFSLIKMVEAGFDPLEPIDKLPKWLMESCCLQDLSSYLPTLNDATSTRLDDFHTFTIIT